MTGAKSLHANLTDSINNKRSYIGLTSIELSLGFFPLNKLFRPLRNVRAKLAASLNAFKLTVAVLIIKADLI
jgi:hypothetical protein